MKPRISYTIWFSQRTGSTLLCKALEATRIAGIPQELFNSDTNLLDRYRLQQYAEIQKQLWNEGSTANEIFGCKHSFRSMSGRYEMFWRTWSWMIHL